MGNNTRILMTAEGKQKLEAELKTLMGPLKKELEDALVKANQILVETGDDSDLSIAKDRQSFNDYRIQELKDRCARAEVIADSAISKSVVQFGSKVVLEGAKRESLTLKIVGVDEANIKNDKISIDSPVAAHLLGKKLGDQVELSTARGKINYTIVELST